ncbi:hypothetical protein GCM10019059_30400 [Camelimonas fluminis]|nr:hypothetical protein GCM10019059_30400 [Camelimonas fluminis]
MKVDKGFGSVNLFLIRSTLETINKVPARCASMTRMLTNEPIKKSCIIADNPFATEIRRPVQGLAEYWRRSKPNPFRAVMTGRRLLQEAIDAQLSAGRRRDEP